MKVGSGLAAPVAMPAARPRIAQERRSPPARYPRATRLARGALSLVLWVALAGGLATAAAGATGYLKGRAAGYAEAEGKAATERAEIEKAARAREDKLRADAQAAADAAAREAADRYQRLDLERLEAQRALSIEQSRTARLRGDLAAAVRDRDRMRDTIAAAASGGVTEADDTAGACRARADALGRALGEALSAHRVCSLDLEDAAGSARALVRWRDAVEASERAQPVTP